MGTYRDWLRVFAYLIFKGSALCIWHYRQGFKRRNRLNIPSRCLLLFAKARVKGERNLIKFGKEGTYRHVDIYISGNNNEVIFGDKTKVYEGLRILIEGNDCRIQIGERTTIGRAKIQLGESSTEVKVGDDCMLSRDITINTSDFHSIIDLETNKRINFQENVSIGHHTWVGNGVYINKGAKIGADSVIAARSLCTKRTYSPNSILAGIPAKVVRDGINWSREKLD